MDESEGGAAGLGDIFSGIKAAANRVLNYATYYLMKERAGVIGRDGVSKVVFQIMGKLPKLKVHLIGHSFGGRVVTAAADALGTKAETKPASMSLLQAAFSHNGFATKFDGSRDGFFRKVVTGQKVTGPIIITHTKNDKAVGLAYPIASKLSGVDASAIGDEHDRFGGLGRNGALVQFTPEAKAGQLLPLGGSYSFTPGKLFNLEGSAFIGGHSEVTGKEVAAAVLNAIQVS
jgi:esterase/lipase superfamily enzyme